jgi:hypothetical protein
LGDNLERLSFEERQAVTHCLIKKVIITGEEVDIHFILPFESSPQAINRQSKEPEGAPGHFYRLRLAHLDAVPTARRRLTSIGHGLPRSSSARSVQQEAKIASRQAREAWGGVEVDMEV